MADITVVAGSTTVSRLVLAWDALPAQRRSLTLGGVAAGLAIAVAATSVVPTGSAIALGIVSVLAAAAALVDLHEHRIPNRILLVSITLVAVAAVAGGAYTTGDVVIGLLIGALPLLVVRYGRGLAMGDVKFAGVLGAAGGLLHPFIGLAAVWFAALSSGLYGISRRRSRLAMGPWLWAGFVVACAAGVLVVQLGGHSWPARH